MILPRWILVPPSSFGCQNLDSFLCGKTIPPHLSVPLGIPNLTLIPLRPVEGLNEVWCSQAPHPLSAMHTESDVAFLKVIDM